MGEAIGIPFNTLSAYERNVIQPSIDNAAKISQFFEVPIEYFIIGNLSKLEFRDRELLNLFHTINSMEKHDKPVVKNYIWKYLKAKQQLADVIAESEETYGLPGIYIQIEARLIGFFSILQIQSKAEFLSP